MCLARPGSYMFHAFIDGIFKIPFSRFHQHCLLSYCSSFWFEPTCSVHRTCVGARRRLRVVCGHDSHLLCTACVARRIFYMSHIPDFVSSNNCVDSIGRCVLYVRVVDVEPVPMCMGT